MKREKIDDGGQAFPVPNSAELNDRMGMTLREYYAGQAMVGLLANGSAGVIPVTSNARDAVEIADALIAALKEPS